MKRTGPDAPKTIEDLMRVTGLSDAMVRREIKEGRLPGTAHPMGDGTRCRFVIPAEAFDRYVKGEWRPQPRPVLPQAPTPIPQASDLIKRKAS